MNINDGATHEIVTRWPEHKQRNCGLIAHWYGAEFYANMTAGIQLIRDHHRLLQDQGATTWTIPADLRRTLDALADPDVTTSLSPSS